MLPMRAVALVLALSSAAPVSLAPLKSDPNGFGKKTLQLFEAMKSNNVTALDSLLAPQFVFTNFVGVSATRGAYLEVFVKKELVIDAYKLDPVSVEVFGNAAVVVYRLAITAHAGGQAWPTNLVSTDTWIKQKAGWQLAARHSSVVASAPATPAPPAAH